MITIIYKTGNKDIQDGKKFKGKRKNAKKVDENDTKKLCPQSSDNVNKLCSYSTDDTYRKCSFITKTQVVKILHFKQFYKHFVFIKDEDGERKKVLKNYIDVNACVKLIMN